MNGGQDLGGIQGFGPVEPEDHEPPFHAEWEKRAMAMTIAMGAAGMWNIDMARHARENRSPADYYSKSYYELWIAGLERLLLDAQLVAAAELATGKAQQPAAQVKRVLHAADVPAVLAKGGPCDRPSEARPRFATGDRIVTKNINPTGHTRLPRYARSRKGVVDRVHGVFVFPDSNAHGKGEQPQHCYSVRFAARDLWGADADPKQSVFIDLWESYLEPA